MPVTVNANGLSVVHRGSGGIASATLPDVCKTPSPPGSPNPVPYPNIALSSDLVQGTMTVTVDGQMAAVQGANFARSTGDEPGIAGGVVSQVNMMEASFISFSPTVMMDGLPVCRLTDKMLMNHGNTVCLGGELQAPVPPPMCPPIPAPEAPKLCTFEKLVIQCGHDKRNYKLQPYDAPGTMLQLITSAKPEELKFTFHGSCGLTRQSPGCAKVHVLNDKSEELPVESNKQIHFPLSDNSDFATDWLALLYDFLQPSSFPRETYTVYGSTCNGTGTEAVVAAEYALIQVFPNASWSGELEFTYKHKKRELETAEKKPGSDQTTSISELDKQGEYELKGNISAKLGRTEMKFGAGVEGKGARSDSDPISRLLFKSTQMALSGLASVLSSIEDFYSTKLDIRWPSIKFGGGIELVELESQPKVVAEGSIFFEAAPLIGLQVKIDILDWIIRMAGNLGGPPGAVLADFLLKIKHRIAEKKTLKGEKQSARLNASFDIGILFTAGGDVGGGLGWKVKQGKSTVDGKKTKIEAGVDFKLEALVKGDATVWVVKAAAGVSLAMQSADGTKPSRISGQLAAKSEPKFACTGTIDFNGLAIYFAYYLDIGSEGLVGEGTQNGKEEDADCKATRKKELKTQAVKDSKCLCTLLEPVSWPKPQTESVKDVL